MTRLERRAAVKALVLAGYTSTHSIHTGDPAIKARGEYGEHFARSYSTGAIDSIWLNDGTLDRIKNI